MKKYFAVAGALLLLAVYAPFSYAQVTSPDSLRALGIQAASLAQQVQLLTALEGQLANYTVSNSYYFGSSLGQGSNGDEVSHLQDVLVGSGYLPSTDATGYFGSLTQQALEKYQKDNGISSTGYAGTVTLSSLNNWWSKHHSPTSPVATTTPPVAVPPIASTTPPVVTASPTVTLTANPASVTPGNSSRLTWNSTNATKCTAHGFNNIYGTSGSATVWPNLTTTYGITCTGKSATAIATASTTVTLTSVASPVPPVPVTVPGAPTGVSALAGNAQATVSFTAPSSNGGSVVTSYTVTSSGGQTASGSASPITVTGLTNGTSYTFTVKATNSVGTGSASSASNPVTPVAPVTVTVPAAPTSVTAVAGNAQATVSFSAPSSNGGAAITSYTVTSSGGQTVTGSASPLVVTGLTNGTAYTFTVKATNSAGAGSASSASSAVTPSAPVSVTPPPAPTPPPVSSSEPAQAVSAGYNLNTFSTDSGFNTTTVDANATYKSGYKWYQFNCYGYPATFANDTINTDGSISVGGDNNNWGSNIVSATCTSGSPGYVGTAFGGGAYIQMTAKYNPVAESSTYIGDNGWPALWTYALEQMVPLPGEQWPGQASGYLHYFEGDLMENYLGNYGVPLDQFTATNHDWYSTNPDATDIENQAYVTVPNSDTYHTYGMLWIPATATASGTISYYFDGTLEGTTHYSKLSSTQAPPPTYTTPWDFGIIDSDHLDLEIGSDNAVPITVQSVDVWQASAANNLVN